MRKLRFKDTQATRGMVIDAVEALIAGDHRKMKGGNYPIVLIDQLVWRNNHYKRLEKAFEKASKLAEVLPEKVVKPDDALDEGRRGGVVDDVVVGKVDAGRKSGACVLESLADGREDFYERLGVAKAIRVEQGIVVGDCVGESCRVEKGGVSLFGFHADYFTKFETPGWYPKKRLDYAMTSVFARAMLGDETGKTWLDHHRKYRWAAIRAEEENAARSAADHDGKE